MKSMGPGPGLSRNVSDRDASAFIKNNLELVHKENKALKQKVEQLERENRDLKKSVYDLSSRHNAVIQQLGKNVKPFNIDSVLPPPDQQGAAEQEGEQREGGLETAPPPRVPSHAHPHPPHPQVEGKRFFLSYDLKGHTGPVYTAKFAPSGNLLASGSFDRSVRVWDVGTQSEVLTLQEHLLNVSDVAWSADSTALLSGAFDHTVKEWDVARGELVSSRTVEGFAQAVCFSPADSNVFLLGSTARRIYVFDRRVGDSPVMEIPNETMVNSLCCYRSGVTALSGDNGGMIKSWDLRAGACTEATSNDEANKPISCVEVSRNPSAGGRGGEEGRYLAVNSYDNVLRVYDRGSFIISPLPLGQKKSGAANKAGLRRLHAVGGHRNKNWPIKSSFFHGPEYLGSSSSAAKVGHHEGGGGGGGEAAEGGEAREGEGEGGGPGSVYGALLLATGSADNNAYIYDVGGPEGTGELMQKLEGHTDRVYSACFHPQEPVLATGSADFTVKVWAPKNLGFVPAI